MQHLPLGRQPSEGYFFIGPSSVISSMLLVNQISNHSRCQYKVQDTEIILDKTDTCGVLSIALLQTAQDQQKYFDLSNLNSDKQNENKRETYRDVLVDGKEVIEQACNGDNFIVVVFIIALYIYSFHCLILLINT